MEEMLDKIKKIEEKYTELGEILSKPEVIQDYNKFRDLSKQRKSMEETVELYHQWQEAKKAIDRMQGGGLGSAVAAGAALAGVGLLWKILNS